MFVVLLACGGQIDNRYNGAKVGEPCTPAIEGNATFDGFSQQEISIELPSPDADPGVLVCLVDHFRGRTTCPYGGGDCETTSGTPVQGEVDAQCKDRRAASVVTWSCRCANALGRTDDGATYCACAEGLECDQIIEPLGSLDANTSGAYCVQAGTAYDPYSACAETCDPNANPCP